NRIDLIQVQLLQGRAAESAESTGDILDLDAQHDPRIGAADARNGLPVQRPVDHAATGNPSGTHGKVRSALHGVQQLLELLGLVGAIGVHLNEDVVACSEPPLEACD